MSVPDFLTTKILVSVSDVRDTRNTGVGVGVNVGFSTPTMSVSVGVGFYEHPKS